MDSAFLVNAPLRWLIDSCQQFTTVNFFFLFDSHFSRLKLVQIEQDASPFVL